MIRIADLPVDWQKENDDFAKAFSSDDVENPVMTLSFQSKMQECHSVQYTDIFGEKFLRGKSGDVLFANADWSVAKSYCLSESDRDFALPLAALCSRFSYFDSLLVHSSFVKYRDKGIVFTGYSGVGKTTQAELWAKYIGARIVNGDKAFLREVDGNFFAYGLPWKGSSDYCLNEKAEISAVVVLRQSEQNRITLLDEKAAEYFMPHIFFPHWDKKSLDNALSVFDRMLKNIPVWLLECRPDEEAVRLTYDKVFG